MIIEIKKHKLKIKFMTKVKKHKPNSQLLQAGVGSSAFYSVFKVKINNKKNIKNVKRIIITQTLFREQCSSF